MAARRDRTVRAGLLLALPFAACLTSGCIAAVPIVATAAMGGKMAQVERQGRTDRRRTRTPAAMPDGTRLQVLPAGTVLPPPGGTVPAAAAGVAGGPTVAGDEATALRLQTLLALENFLELRVRYLRDKASLRSMILGTGSTAEAPRFDRCGERPLAVLFDLDGLADASVAATAMRVREQEVTVLFETGDASATPAAMATMVDRLGIGPVVEQNMIWMPQAGDPPGNDARRARIAARYCVVAMVGGKASGFADLIAATPRAASAPAIAALWGAGWFLLPRTGA